MGRKTQEGQGLFFNNAEIGLDPGDTAGEGRRSKGRSLTIAERHTLNALDPQTPKTIPDLAEALGLEPELVAKHLHRAWLGGLAKYRSIGFSREREWWKATSP